MTLTPTSNEGGAPPEALPVGPASGPAVTVSETERLAAERELRFEKILEIVTAILLGVATLATSWSGYQASRWAGVQSTLYSTASALRVESTRASTAAGQERTVDVVLFGNWLEAYTEENELLATFYQERFRAEFMPAFDAWVESKPLQNPDALPSPFAQPEYVLANEQEAQRLDEAASATFIEGQAANQQGDDYVLNAVLMASVLFFTGISQRFVFFWVRVAMVAAAIVICLFGLYHIATYPIY